MDLARAHDIVHTNSGGMHQNCQFCQGEMTEAEVKKAATKIAADNYKPTVNSNVPYNQRLQSYDEKEFAELSTEDRKKLNDSSFAYIDSKGVGHLPINDAAHVRNALARFNQTHFESDADKASARKKIDAKAKELGVDAADNEKKNAEPFLHSFVNVMSFAQKNEPPTRIKVMPIGTIDSPVYGKVQLTKDVASDMVKNFNDSVRASSKTAGLPIDFEHGDTQYKDMAAGWIKKLFAENDGIYADVDWTDAGTNALQKKLYKFYSPGFYLKGYTDPETGKEYQNVMTGGGLVNKPGMPHSLPPIVNSEQNKNTLLTENKNSNMLFVEIKNSMNLSDIIVKEKTTRTDEENKFIEAHKEELTFAQAKAEGFAQEPVKETPKDESSKGQITMSEQDAKQFAELKEMKKEFDLNKMIDKVKEVTFSEKGVKLPTDQVKKWASKLVTMSEADQKETLEMLGALPEKEIFKTFGADNAMNFDESNPQVQADTLTKAKIKEAKDKGQDLDYGSAQNMVFAENPALQEKVFPRN